MSSISWFHLFTLFSPPPYQPVPANRESSLRQPPLPPPRACRSSPSRRAERPDGADRMGPPTLWHQRQLVQDPLAPVVDGRAVWKCLGLGVPAASKCLRGTSDSLS